MKAIALTVLMILIHAHVRAADWTMSGGMSAKLALTVSYQPESSRFVVVLKNQSTDTLSIGVEPRRFHGAIVVAVNGGQAVEYWDAAFRQLLLTSAWGVPVQPLRPQAEITWKVPVSQLRDLHDGKLDTLSLRGATVHAVLEEAAVVPARGYHISDNAKQTSKPIEIPADSR